METETIDRLFLELSQFAKAQTARELELAAEVGSLANSLNNVQKYCPHHVQDDIRERFKAADQILAKRR